MVLSESRQMPLTDCQMIERASINSIKRIVVGEIDCDERELENTKMDGENPSQTERRLYTKERNYKILRVGR